MSSFKDNTDDQTIDVFSLSGDNLQLSLESDGQNSKTVSLSSFKQSMSDIKETLQGYYVSYIIQQKYHEVYKQLENVLNEIELSFFNSFIKGGIESKEERLKFPMIGEKNRFSF